MKLFFLNRRLLKLIKIAVLIRLTSTHTHTHAHMVIYCGNRVNTRSQCDLYK